MLLIYKLWHYELNITSQEFVMLHELRFPILTWDFRGLWASLPDTTPSGPEFISDAQEITLLKPLLQIPINNLYGYSLGWL